MANRREQAGGVGRARWGLRWTSRRVPLGAAASLAMAVTGLGYAVPAQAAPAPATGAAAPAAGPNVVMVPDPLTGQLHQMLLQPGQYLEQLPIQPGQKAPAVVPVTGSAQTGSSVTHASAIHSAVVATGSTGSIAGSVTDSSNSPLSGVCVEASPVFGGTGANTTSSSGTYTLSGLAPGRYLVMFNACSAGGYATEYYPNSPSYMAAQAVSVTGGAVTSSIDATLVPGGTISGTVTDATGASVGNLCVEGMAVDGASTIGRTDSSGQYSLSGLPAGDATVQFGVPGCNSANYASQAYSGRPETALGDLVAVKAGSPAQGIDATMQPGGQISGTVTDASTGKPIAGATVYVQNDGLSFPVFTDSSGVFTLSGLATGSYLLAFGASGYSYSLYGGTNSSGPTYVPVNAGTAVSGVDMSLTAQSGGTVAAGTASVSGTVTDSNGIPLQDICVQARPSSSNAASSSAQTAADGTYTLRGLTGGTAYEIYFYSCGYGPARYNVAPQYYSGQTSSGNANAVTPTSGQTTTSINATMQPGGEISGAIVDGSGNPVPGSNVSASGPTGGYSGSDYFGHYALIGLPGGSYQVAAQPTGLQYDFYKAGSPQSVSVTTGSTAAAANLMVSAGGAIRGVVTDQSGNPLPAIGVSATLASASAGATASQITTDAFGGFVAGGLPAGSYNLSYNAGQAPSGCYQSQTSTSPVSVTDGTVTGADATLQATTPCGAATSTGLQVSPNPATVGQTVTLTATVTPQSGTAVPTGTVNFFDGTTQIGGAALGSNGQATFTTSSLSSGTHSLTATYQGTSQYASSTSSAVSESESSSTTAGVGTISGVITATGGADAQNVCAEVYQASNSFSAVADSCSDMTGHYSVTGLSAGQYLVQFVDGDTTRHDVPQWYQNEPDSTSANLVTLTSTAGAANINAVMAAGGWITGQITDASTKKPIPNACLTVLDSSRNLAGYTANPSGPGVINGTCADSSGNFVTGGMPAGTYHVDFNGSGLGGPPTNTAYSQLWYDGQASQASADPVTVTAGQATASINGALQPAVAISGTVSDTNGPVTNVSVTFLAVTNNGTNYAASALTASDGTYTAYVPAGSYQVEFAPTTGNDLTQWYNNEPDQTHADTLTVMASTPQTGINATLTVGASISGTVTDSVSNSPVANMTVEACRPQTSTQSGVCQDATTHTNGTYTVPRLPAGTWFLEFMGSTDGNYLNQYYPNTVVNDSVQPTTFTLAAGQTLTGKDDSAVQGSTFSGTVTDAQTGAPLSDICVSAVPTTSGGYSSGTGCTDQQGRYTTSGVPSGSYQLEYTNGSGRYITQWYNDVPSQGQATTVTVTQPAAKTGLNQTMQLGGVISGTVTDAVGTTPLANICIEAYPVTGNTPSATGIAEGCTNSQGQYSTSPLAAGSYDIGFVDYTGKYTAQYWQDVTSLASATPVTVTAGTTTTGIGAALAAETVPGAPTNVQASAGDGAATVTFTAPTDTGGSAITSYTVIPSPACAACSGTTTATPSATVTGLTNGQSYTFTVTATNSTGTGPASQASNAVTPAASTGGTQTVPGAPTNVSATVNVSTVNLSYGAPASDGNSAITGYKVTPSPACTNCSGLAPTGTSTSVTGLTAGTTYTFTISAVNANGTGPASVASQPVTPTAAAQSPVSSSTASSSTPATAQNAGTTATASGGTGTVTVSQYPSDPAAAPDFSSTHYLDVSISNGSTFASVVVKDCNLGGATSLYWWNPSAGSGGAWQTVIGDPTDTSGLPGCLTETIDAKSSPNLTQLGGTIFAAGTTGTSSGSAGSGGSGGSGGGGGGGTTTTTTPPTTTPPTTAPPTTAPPTTTPPTSTPPTIQPVCSTKLASGSVVGMAQTADGNGYWIATSTGQVASCGDAPSLGNGPAGTVAIAAAPTGNGYWLVTATGQVSAFGSAMGHGSLATTLHLNGAIVAMAADPATGGYWLLGSDGGVFAFDAPFYGSTGNIHLDKPAVGMEATPDGQGYRFVASDGGIFDYGDAAFQGSMGGHYLAEPVVGMADDPATGGYWLVAADGGVFSYAAPFYGSTGGIALAKPVIAMTALANGNGYRLVATDGGIFDFGAAGFEGSAAS